MTLSSNAFRIFSSEIKSLAIFLNSALLGISNSESSSFSLIIFLRAEIVWCRVLLTNILRAWGLSESLRNPFGRLVFFVKFPSALWCAFRVASSGCFEGQESRSYFFVIDCYEIYSPKKFFRDILSQYFRRIFCANSLQIKKKQ